MKLYKLILGVSVLELTQEEFQKEFDKLSEDDLSKIFQKEYHFKLPDLKIGISNKNKINCETKIVKMKAIPTDIEL